MTTTDQPALGDVPDPTAVVAATIRQLADEFAQRSYTPDQLATLRDTVETARDLARAGTERPLAERVREFADEMSERIARRPSGEDGEFVHFRRSPYTGPANPLAPRAARMWRRDDAVVAEIILGAALEGAPGRAHGGAVAAVFDDIMGAVQRITGRAAFTRSLSVRYIAPFPIHAPVEITAYETEVDDRFFTVAAEARDGDRVVATAEAIFTRIGDEGFATLGPRAEPT